MKPLLPLFILLAMVGCETILKKDERLITKKEISQYPAWGDFILQIIGFRKLSISIPMPTLAGTKEQRRRNQELKIKSCKVYEPERYT
jgi:hypothetical protein